MTYLLSLLLYLSQVTSSGTPQPVDEVPETPRDIVVASDCRLGFHQTQEVAGDIGGVLLKRASLGDTVTKGDVCARFKDQVAAALFAVADQRAKNRSRLLQAEHVLVDAESELSLVTKANAEAPNSFPQAEVDRRQRACKRASLGVQVEKEELEIAKLQRVHEERTLNALQLRAEIDGIVTRTHKNAGEGVSAGEPVLTIVNPGLLRAEGFVSAIDAELVMPGQAVEVFVHSKLREGSTQDSPKASGKIILVDPEIQPVSQSVKIWALIDNRKGKLRAGMEVQLHIASSKNDVVAEKR